jgi:preprotein translocase subunit SecF
VSVIKGDYNFVKHRNKYFFYPLLIFFLAFIVFLVSGLNIGIDFTSGTRVEIANPNLSTEVIRMEFREIEMVPETINTAAENSVAVVMFKGNLESTKINKISNHFSEKYNVEPTFNVVSSQIGKQQVKNASIALSLATIGIFLYVGFRFGWFQGFASIVALVHDVLIMVSVFCIFRLEINMVFISATLLVVGYSVNDTIVTFGKLRQHIAEITLNTFNITKIVNDSLKQTLLRSINTSITVIIVACTFLIFGGESLRLFSIALLIGFIAGTYSSLFIAIQLWLLLKQSSLRGKANNSIGSKA